MATTLKLAFGKEGTEIRLPEGFRYTVLEAKGAAAVQDEQAAINAALDNPVARPPLERLAAGRQSAAISVCDITRPAPNRLVLPPVLARLERAGMERSRIVILIATGLHRAATASEIREIVGEEIAARYRVENHDARDLAAHRYLGNNGIRHSRMGG